MHRLLIRCMSDTLNLHNRDVLEAGSANQLDSLAPQCMQTRRHVEGSGSLEWSGRPSGCVICVICECESLKWMNQMPTCYGDLFTDFND